ncbi:MAG: homocysteine S-methyltransferase family protein [Candidatus Omnitrophota bacterium]|nr:MAG: homocysteine S-methyltransferase family protein [Candidatus Omnitrophota bacterium]
MTKKNKIHKILKRRVLVLDGATGTELYRRGMPAGVCPEKWCLENPGVIQGIHFDYACAGSDVVYTCTFGANEYKLKQYGQTDVYGINKKLAQLARKAAGPKVLVAGDIGPTGHFVHPFGSLSFEDAVKAFKKQVKGLVAGGVDLFVIETMMDIQEARAALIAVKEEVPAAFVMVTMTFESDGRTLGGTDPVSALIILQSLGADMVGCNCSRGPKGMLEIVKIMKPYATVPLVAKPNAGMPKLIKGKTFFDMDSNRFAELIKSFTTYGVAALGGCCGTTPEHIHKLKKAIARKETVLPKRKAISAISSARKSVVFGESFPLIIVGESINPSGKKALAEDLRSKRFSLLRSLAKEQESNGAQALDVNVAASGVNEAQAMERAIEILSQSFSLPLSIDSADTSVIEKALRLYPGRALINSISAEKQKIDKLLPVAAKYGAMFILLPVTDKGVPQTAQERKKIINSMFKEAQKRGFSKDDILVDGLVMTISSNPLAAIETLKTIKWCKRQFRTKTIVGLSNVSFGLPQRKLINSTFLGLTQNAGLTAAIANPLHVSVKKNKLAENLLLGKDKDATKFVTYFSKRKERKVKLPFRAKLSPKQKVHEAILEGNRETIINYIDEALAVGIAPRSLVQETMIAAITQVGDLFDKKQYFLPQLVASAETMKKGFDHLAPRLKEYRKELGKKTLILLATVEGDIHDIGKNIVALMLRNHGFKVIDLGKDVSAKKIIQSIKQYKPALVGLSALMTTTMVNMPEVIKLAKKEGLRCKFIVGGAVLNQHYARSIGADYAKDGVEAVRVAKKLIINK